MNKFFLVVLMLVLAMPCIAAEKLVFKNAWVREAPPMAKNLAGYVELMNASNESIIVESITSPFFQKVKMHDMSLHNGMMHMSHLDSVSLPPGGSFSFEPGGKHLMLMKPKQRIKAGLIIPIVFKLHSGKTIAFDFEVRAKD